MEFSDDIGKLQRLMAASSAGIARRQAIMDNLVIKADDKIIDIGCGGGYLLELLAKSIGTKGRIYGLDPSEKQISQARLRCEEIENISLLHSYADQIDLEDNTCDVVTSTQTLEYIPDVDAALSASPRVLKVDGELVNISILWDHFRFYGAEKKLNKMYADAFKRGSGKAVLNHLKQISIFSVAGAGIDPNSLLHLEGQRYIVAEIERRIEIGKAIKNE